MLIVVGILGPSSACGAPEALSQAADPVPVSVEAPESRDSVDPGACNQVFRQVPLIEYMFEEGLTYLDSGAADAYEFYEVAIGTGVEMALSEMEKLSAADSTLNKKVLLFAGQQRKLHAHTDKYARDVRTGAINNWSDSYYDRWIDEFVDISMEGFEFLLEADALCGNIGTGPGSVFLGGGK